MKGMTRWLSVIGLAAMLSLGAAGCANTWDGFKEDVGFGDNGDEEVVE